MKILQQNFIQGLLLIVLLVGGRSWGQSIWNNPITDSAPSSQNPFTSGDVKDANITVSGVGRGPGIVGAAAGNRYSANSWSATFDATDYFYFTLTPNAGYKIDFTNLVLYLQSSNTGANTYAVRSSLDNYAANIVTGSVTANGSQSGPYTINLGAAAFDNVTTSITFRLYGWGNGAAGGTFSINEFTFNGNVALNAPPTPVATAATNILASGFTANWNSVTGATGYRLDVATDAAFANLLEDYDNIAVTGLSHFVHLGIQPDVDYYYRVRAEIGAQTSASSNVIDVTTLNPLPATVVTTEVLTSGITASTAASGGNVTNTGNDTVTARGVVWATTPNPTIASSSTANGTGAGTFTSSLAGLSPNTQYYYRAYATNSTGTSYGAEYSFWTHANTPGAPAVSDPGIFSLNIALDINGNPANTLYAIVIEGGGYENDYVNADSSVGIVPVWLTAAQWGAIISVNALQPGTTYTFSVSAQNGAGIQTPWSATGQGTTNALTGPTTLTLISNTIDFEPACLSTDPNGAIGSITFDATNLSGTGMGTGTVVISGPDGAALEGISFSGSATGTFVDGSFQIGNVLEGADQTVYVRFDPTAGVSYGSITFEIALVDTMNNTAMPLEVEVVIVDLPTAPPAQTVCNGTTVASLQSTTGTNIKWYTTLTGGTALTATEVLTAQTYYASQSIGECESGRTPVAVTVTPLPAAPIAAPQLFCGPSTVSQLVVTTGASPKWYTAETGGAELAGTEALATATYYVSQTVTDCEGPRTAVAVTVNPIPAAPVASAQAFCGPTTVAALMVTTGEATKWYAAETGGAELDETAAITTGTYYVSQTMNGCESPRTSVAVTVNAIPAAPAVDNVQTFCTAATIADLDTTGTGILWYTAPAGGTALAETTAIAVGTSLYYASQTVDGCESTLRSAVAVQLNNTPAPAAADQSFCGAATVSQLATAGIAPQWYDVATGGSVLEGTATLATGTYYVSQTMNGCESAVRTAVEVTVNAIPAAPVAVAQSFCGSGIVSQLMVTAGENIQWYAAEIDDTALAGNTPLATGSYYASQTLNGCEGTRTMVAVTVNTVPATPEVSNMNFCNDATASELIAAGAGLAWYETATGGEAIEGTVAVETGLYYVTQTVNGCESARTGVMVTVTEVEGVEGEAIQEFEAGETLADLEAEGEDIVWYANEQLTEELPETTILVDGTIYYAVATQGECSSEALAITVEEVMGTGGFDKTSLSIFPNPVNDMLNLSYNEMISSVVVYNLLGQSVLSEEFNTAKAQVDMSSLAAGNYIVKVAAGDTSATIKVIKR